MAVPHEPLPFMYHHALGRRAGRRWRQWWAWIVYPGPLRPWHVMDGAHYRNQERAQGFLDYLRAHEVVDPPFD